MEVVSTSFLLLRRGLLYDLAHVLGKHCSGLELISSFVLVYTVTVRMPPYPRASETANRKPKVCFF